MHTIDKNSKESREGPHARLATQRVLSNATAPARSWAFEPTQVGFALFVAAVSNRRKRVLLPAVHHL